MDFPKSVPGVGLVGGQFVDENQATGQVGSLIPAKWGNDVTTELLGVIEEGDLLPDEENPQQLRAAVRAIVDKVAPVASQAEAETNDEAMANNVKRMTPLRVFQTLRSAAANATELLRGALRVGTQAEVNAGALDDVAVTPKKMKLGLVYSFGVNGYFFLPSWLMGVGIQWGSVTGSFNGTYAASFPMAFPNQCFSCWPTWMDAFTGGGTEYVQIDKAFSQTGFKAVTCTDIGTDFGLGSVNFGYLAIGR